MQNAFKIHITCYMWWYVLDSLTMDKSNNVQLNTCISYTLMDTYSRNKLDWDNIIIKYKQLN